MTKESAVLRLPRKEIIELAGEMKSFARFSMTMGETFEGKADNLSLQEWKEWNEEWLRRV